VSSRGQIMEIKRATAAVAALNSELAKQQEQVEECLRLKAFLDSVTPEAWFAQQHSLQEAALAARQAAWQVCPSLINLISRKFADIEEGKGRVSVINLTTRSDALTE
jgi:hypothetical protein